MAWGRPLTENLRRQVWRNAADDIARIGTCDTNRRVRDHRAAGTISGDVEVARNILTEQQDGGGVDAITNAECPARIVAGL